MTTGAAWYPLRLTTTFRTDPSGGRRIAERLGRRGLSDRGPVSETDELGGDPAGGWVRNGRFAGERLDDLVAADAEAIVGADWHEPRFPVAVRLVDASRAPPLRAFDLISGRPPERQHAGAVVAALHILDCPAGSMVGIGTGSAAGDDTPEQTAASVLARFVVQPGETIPLPARASYVYDPGTLAYEVNRTFVVRCDAGYADRGGSVSAADRRFSPRPIHGLTRFDGVVRVVTGCGAPELALERWNLAMPYRVAGRERCLVLTNLGSAVGIAWPGGLDTLPRATTCIVPAAMGAFTLVPNGKAVVLACFVPNVGRDVIMPLRATGYSDSAIAELGAWS